jgi:hypothetical protein
MEHLFKETNIKILFIFILFLLLRECNNGGCIGREDARSPNFSLLYGSGGVIVWQQQPVQRTAYLTAGTTNTATTAAAPVPIPLFAAATAITSSSSFSVEGPVVYNNKARGLSCQAV